MSERMRARWAGLRGRAVLAASVVAIVAASVVGLNEWADAQTVAAVPHSAHDAPAPAVD